MGIPKFSRRGQAALLLTLSLPVLLGILGLVVDIGWAYWRQEACLTAAQSAAIAGVQAAQTIGSSAGNFTCGTGSTQVPCNASNTFCPSSLTTATNPLQAGCLYAKQNGFTTGASRRQVYSTSGITGSFSGVTPTYWMTFVATESIPQTFSAILGNTMTTVAGASTAAILGSTTGGCVYVMAASPNTDISMSGGTIASNCGVYLNSSSSSALVVSGGCIATSGSGNCTSSGSATAKTNIVGNYVSSCSPITNCVRPAPVTSAATQSDPFASLAVPTTSGLTNQSNVSLSSGTRTINPGIYTSAITISGGTLTLTAGLYYLQGGISMSGGAIRDDNTTGVTLYDTSGSMAMSGGTATLHAPTTGTYQGILLFQNRTTTGSIALSGGTSTYTGAVYGLKSSLAVSGGTYTNTTFVVNTMAVSGGGIASINGAANTTLTSSKIVFIQ